MRTTKQKTYRIYNLKSCINTFECDGYLFEKVPEYDRRIDKIYRPGIQGQDKEHIGTFQHTFIARYLDGKEPPSSLKTGLEGQTYYRIEDIIFLIKFIKCTQVCLHSEIKHLLPMRNADPLVRGDFSFTRQLNKMLTALTPELADKWKLKLALEFYFQSFWIFISEHHVMNTSICMELLSELFLKQVPITPKDFNDNYPFLSQYKFNKRLTKQQILFHFLINFEKLSIGLKINEEKMKSLFDFCGDFRATRNSIAHQGDIDGANLKTFEKHLPPDLGENEEILRKRHHISIQTIITQKIIKCFIADLLNYPDSLSNEYSCIQNFINTVIFRGNNILNTPISSYPKA